MKANEAPEKIYIQPNAHDGWFEGNTPNELFVEYIRTDVFVEKAFKFFDDHLWEYIDGKKANCDTFINIDGDKIKEDFKKAMRL